MTGLHFESDLNNDKLNSAIDETLRRIQGLSDATVSGGEDIDATFKKTAAEIEEAFQKLDQASGIHKKSLKDLEKKYKDLQSASAEAFRKGDDKLYSKLQQEGKAIQGQIQVRKRLLREIEATADSLAKEEQALDTRRAKLKKHTKTVKSFETQLRLARERVMALEAAGKRNTAEYEKAQVELGRLRDIMNDANRQAKILSHDQADFQGVLSGLTGLSGGYSAATGAVSLFAGENENLQLVMTRVQSLMSITIGLQQVQQTLDKDSAFRLVTLVKLKKRFGNMTHFAAKSLMRFGVAARGARIAASALTGVLTLGISAAVSAAIYAFNKYNEKQEEAKEKAKALYEINKQGREEYFKTGIEIDKVLTQIKSFNGSKNEEKKLVDKLNSKYGEALGYYSSLAKWYETLIQKSQYYTEVLFLQSKAQALINKATEADLKVLEIETSGVEAYRPFWGDGGKAEMWLGGDNLNAEGSDPAELAYEKAIKEEQGKINSYKESVKSINNEIEKLKKKYKIGDFLKPTTTDLSKDPFKKMLQDRKSEYNRFKKYLNSGDTILVEAGKKGLEKLKKDGATYLEFLKNQQESILKIPQDKRNATQTKNLASLNDAIASETKTTVLNDFNDKLQEELGSAKNILSKMEVIQNFKEKLDSDDSGLGADKADILNQQSKKIEAEAKKHTDKLLESYSGYLDKKLKYDEQYVTDIALLNKKIEAATTKEEKALLEQAKNKRTKEYERGTGDADYDALLSDYADFEEKKQKIIDEYDSKREIAQRHNNKKLVEDLNVQQQKALSTLALDELKASPDWELMFEDLDEVSTRKLEELVQKIEGMTAYLGVEFDPKDLATLKDKMRGVTKELQERNPFKAVGASFKKYKEATDKESKSKAATEMLESAGKAAGLLSGGLDAVVGGVKQMGISMDEESEIVLKDIGGMIEGAGQLATGIASGNPLSIIQGSIGLLTSAFDLFNSKDRKANREIKKHAEAIKKLEEAYQDLSRAVDKALGSKVYADQKAMIANMKRQQDHLRRMIRHEWSKKKTDRGKIKEYQSKIKELNHAIEDTLESIAKDIAQTDAKSYAVELGDALVSAFEKGGDAADNFVEKITNKVIKNAIVNQLRKKFLEEQLGQAIDQLTDSMGSWKGDSFKFDGLSDSEIKRFKDLSKTASDNFSKALEEYEKIFKGVTEDKVDTSFTGALKGVSESTASMVGGQINAVRINQLESTQMLRNSLFQLQKIARNTRHNSNLTQLTKIDDVITKLDKLDIIAKALSKNSDPLRSQGLGG